MKKKILSLVFIGLLLFLIFYMLKSKESFANNVQIPNLKGVSNLFLPNFVVNKVYKNQNKNEDKLPSNNIKNMKPLKNNYKKPYKKQKNNRFSNSNKKINYKEDPIHKLSSKGNLPYNPGYSFAPPSSWRFDESKPPKCLNGKCGLKPVPVYDKGLPTNYLDYTGTQSIYPVLTKKRKGITLTDLFEKELYIKMASQNMDPGTLDISEENIEPMLRETENLDYGERGDKLLTPPLIDSRLAKMIKSKVPIDKLKYDNFVYSDKSFNDMVDSDPITKLLEAEDQGNEQEINKTEYCNMFCKQGRVCNRACKKYCTNFGVCSK